MAIFSGVKSQGTWTVSASHLADAETLAIGGITYRFKTTIAQAYDVLLPAGGDDAADVALVASLIKAINLTGTIGTGGTADYYTGTLKHKMVKAAVGSTTRKIVVTALMPGTAGNMISFVDSSSAGSVDAATLGTTTAGTGSAHADLNTWISGMQSAFQHNGQVEAEFEKLVLELT